MLHAITPLIVPSVIPCHNPEHRELLLSDLRLAMGEEDVTQLADPNPTRRPSRRQRGRRLAAQGGG